MTNTPDQVTTQPSAGDSGSLADMVAVPTSASASSGAAKVLAIKIAVLTGLFVVLNYWQFRTLVVTWLDNANWSHGFIIPLFSLFLLYNRREELFSARSRPCLWALPLMILALMAQVVSFHPISNYWLCQLSMVAVLFFLVLYLAGTSVMRVAWLPILYLAIAMPISGAVYTRISVPLQELAAQGSAAILQVCGVQMQVTASHLSIKSISGNWHELTVAEACSGVRSLMAYVALGVAWAYLEDRPVWQRVTLVIAIVPVAIVCNIIRVTITCTAYVVDRVELGQKFMHTFTGMLMLIPALIMFLLLSWTLKRLFLESDEDDEDDGQDAEASPEARA